jgi:hypothetical protein
MNNIKLSKYDGAVSQKLTCGAIANENKRMDKTPMSAG